MSYLSSRTGSSEPGVIGAMPGLLRLGIGLPFTWLRLVDSEVYGVSEEAMPVTGPGSDSFVSGPGAEAQVLSTVIGTPVL